MIFTYKELDLVIGLDENCWLNIVVENPSVYCSLLENIWDEMNGNGGNVILSEKNELVAANKALDIVWNPITCNCNDTKVLKKVYQELEKIACEDTATLYDINAKILSYINTVTEKMDVSLDVSAELNFLDLCKAYSITITEGDEGITDRIIQYIRTMHKLCGKNIFIFVNLESYIDEAAWSQLIDTLIYEKVYYINVTNKEKVLYNSAEKQLIIDKDKCVISELTP